MSLTLGGIRQLGFVVRDIETAMVHWSRVLGVGPWFHLERSPGGADFRYYGKPSPSPHLFIALANSGDLQVELIQQLDESPSLYLDSLRRSGECAQHFAYWTDRFDDLAQQLFQAGYVEGHAGQRGSQGRFAYFVHSDLPSAMIELSELSGGKGDRFAMIAPDAEQEPDSGKSRFRSSTDCFWCFRQVYDRYREKT